VFESIFLAAFWKGLKWAEIPELGTPRPLDAVKMLEGGGDFMRHSFPVASGICG